MQSIFRPDDLSGALRRGGGAEVSLAQLGGAGTAISWDEAVAIVQQTARVLLDHPGTPAVDLAGAFLQESGDVVLRLSRSGDPEASVRSMGELLRALLAETPSPTPLNLVIANAASTPPSYGSVAELSLALSRYERPNRRELARGVYQRWLAFTPPAVRPPDTAAVAVQKVQPDPTTWQFAPSTTYLRALERRRRLTRNIYLAAFGTVLATAILVSEWRVATAVRHAAATLANETAVRAWRARPALASVVDNGVGWVRAPFSGTVKAPAPEATSSRPAAPLVDPTQRIRVTAPASRPQPQAVATATTGRNSTPSLPGTQIAAQGVSAQQTGVTLSPQPPAVLDLQAALALEPSIPPATPQGSAAAPRVDVAAAALDRRDSGAVYTPADADVAPPVPLDLRLSDSPPSGSQQFVALDIIVDETGRVETATLVGRPASMREAMLATGHLSAAKTWRFRPASRDGEPVKYRRRVWLVAHD